MADMQIHRDAKGSACLRSYHKYHAGQERLQREKPEVVAKAKALEEKIKLKYEEQKSQPVDQGAPPTQAVKKRKFELRQAPTDPRMAPLMEKAGDRVQAGAPLEKGRVSKG